MNQLPTFASELAHTMLLEYALTYKCMVNLEATINMMLHCGLTVAQIGTILVNIYDHVDFIPEPELNKVTSEYGTC